ncbi:3-oxoacyl-ACP synthase III family protein [Nocardiopsis kunsanensis]|nr:beta-ketoacyl-ACP synthase III [Nocardiopsis kunsanensis]
MSQPHVGVLGTGSYLPSGVVSNTDLASNLGIDPDWILERTGIRERRAASAEEATSDLAFHAASAALADAKLAPGHIDLIIVATSTPDHPMPSTACLVQGRAGAENAAALDVDSACTGFVSALQLARSMICTDQDVEHALVIGADAYSRILDYQDRSTSVLFGDGAGAVVLGPVSEGFGIRGSCMGADGSLEGLVGVPAGGSRYPASSETVRDGSHFFKMNGRGVRDFASEKFSGIIKRTLDGTQVALEDIDLVVPHQANIKMVRMLAEESGIAADRVALTGEFTGNTAAASVAVALDEAVRSGRVNHGSHVLLVAFGAGMTWGGTLIRWEGRAL